MYNLPAVPPARTETDIAERVKLWHDSEANEVSLHEYLGWTWEDYCEWVMYGTIP
jgi:hypothetical protein